MHSLLQQGIEPPQAEVDATDARLTREALRGIVAGLQEGFHQQRRDRARGAWQGLSDDQRQLVHTLMQATLHKFTLERIESDGWQGSLYEVSRLDVLGAHGFVALPPHLVDLIAYVDNGDLLSAYQPDDRQRLLAELREAAA